MGRGENVMTLGWSQLTAVAAGGDSSTSNVTTVVTVEALLRSASEARVCLAPLLAALPKAAPFTLAAQLSPKPSATDADDAACPRSAALHSLAPSLATRLAALAARGAAVCVYK